MLTALQSSSQLLDIPASWLLAGGLLAIGGGALGRWWREQRTDPFRPAIDRLQALQPEAATPDAENTPQERPVDRGGESASDGGGVSMHDGREASRFREDRVPGLMRTARDRYGEGAYQGAIQAAYVAVQHHSTEGADGAVWTHWEFYEWCAQEDVDVDISMVKEITELYEGAMYEPNHDPSEEEAIRSITIAQRITGFQWPVT